MARWFPFERFLEVMSGRDSLGCSDVAWRQVGVRGIPGRMRLVASRGGVMAAGLHRPDREPYRSDFLRRWTRNRYEHPTPVARIIQVEGSGTAAMNEMFSRAS